MPRHDLYFSGYQSMWVIAMFDLPVKTNTEKREYVRFRNVLLDNGFSQLQYSVYARFCMNEAIAVTQRKRIKSSLPANGYVRVLSVTDRQFEKMQNFYGKNTLDSETKPSQLTLF